MKFCVFAFVLNLVALLINVYTLDVGRLPTNLFWISFSGIGMGLTGGVLLREFVDYRRRKRAKAIADRTVVESLRRQLEETP